jgi:hypothetical protein
MYTPLLLKTWRKFSEGKNKLKKKKK